MRSTGSLAFVFTQLLLVVFTESRTVQGTNEPSRTPCLGCSIEKDANDPIYFDLATESLEHHVKTQGLTGSHKVVKVTKATQQVVAGFITRLTFNALLDSGSVTCDSEILEPPVSTEAKQITVTCVDQRRQTRQVYGGQNDKDANDPIYTDLAKESLAKYVSDSGLPQTYEVVNVKKATVQVVAGTLTRIEFDALVGSATPLSCRSEILEQAWLAVKDIKITCDSSSSRAKRGIPGGEITKDPNNPIYVKLAEESLAKYKQDKGLTETTQLIQVVKASTQVVSGKMTRIDFTARLGAAGSLTCHSEIWEQAWINRKEITVDCK